MYHIYNHNNIDMVHYVYKITNIKTNLFYIGSRSHPNPLNDNYMGSSKILNNLYENEGLDTFKKNILKTFPNRELANQYEDQLIKHYLNISPHMIYNLRSPGSFKEKSDLYNKRRDLWEDYYFEIRTKYVKGTHIPELANEYNCDIGTIHQIVIDLKIGRKWSNSWKNYKLIIEDYNRGYSRKFLSLKYNCDIKTIKTILLENNVEIRTTKEQHIINKSLGIKQGKKREVDLELVKEYYVTQDLTLKETAKKLNIGIDALKKRLLENNIPIKSYNWSTKQHRHNAWVYKKEIIEDLKYMNKKQILEKYKIKDYVTLNKIIK